jgi:catalase
MDNIAEAMQGVPAEIVHFYLADKAYGLGVAERMGLSPVDVIPQAAE